MHCAQYIEASQCQLRRESHYRTIFDVWCSDPNYFWACALQATKEDKERRTEMYRLRDRWLRIERILDRPLVLGFAAGVFSSLVYIVLRILAK